MLQKLFFALICLISGAFLFIFSLASTILVADHGKLYIKTVAPLGINYTKQKYVGSMPERPETRCSKGVPFSESRNANSKNDKYSLYIVPYFGSSSNNIFVRSYPSMSSCYLDSNALAKLVKQNNFEYKFRKNANFIITFLAGLVMLFLGLIIPFGKVMTKEEAQKYEQKAAKKLLNREMTEQELIDFRERGIVPKDMEDNEAVKDIKNFIAKNGDFIEKLDENSAKINNIINIINKFK